MIVIGHDALMICVVSILLYGFDDQSYEIRQAESESLIKIKYCSTEDQVADTMTKA